MIQFHIQNLTWNCVCKVQAICPYHHAQSEHSKGCLAIMLSKDLNLIKEVKNKIEKYIKTLPRKKIISQSLKKYGALIYAKSNKEILNIIEFLSPEHVELSIRNYKKYSRSCKTINKQIFYIDFFIKFIKSEDNKNYWQINK